MGALAQLQAAQVRVAKAVEYVEAAEATVEQAATALANLKALRQQKVDRRAAELVQHAAEAIDDAEPESLRVFRLFQPLVSHGKVAPPGLVLVARCAATLLSVDLTGSGWRRLQRATGLQLANWEDAQKVFARSDIERLMRDFDAGRLLDMYHVTTLVGTKAQWSPEPSAAGQTPTSIASIASARRRAGNADGQLTLEAARATSPAAGLLFIYCARILSGLEEVREEAQRLASEAAGPEVERQTEINEEQRRLAAARTELYTAEQQAMQWVEEAATEQAERDIELLFRTCSCNTCVQMRAT